MVMKLAPPEAQDELLRGHLVRSDRHANPGFEYAENACPDFLLALASAKDQFN
jgi:hypothetical protein